MSLVSILGLARSPTFLSCFGCLACLGFNTWAREEPNLPEELEMQAKEVSILGLARSPTPGKRQLDF